MSKHMNSGMYSSETDEWETPQDVFDALNSEFHFSLDVCATDQNRKCDKYFTKEQDGLKQNWGSDTVWCNPPYGRGIENWILKCAAHSVGGGTAVMLIPSRTDNGWFHDYIYGKAEIRFVRGRLKFGGAAWNAPFPSMIVIFRPKQKDKINDMQIRMDI